MAGREGRLETASPGACTSDVGFWIALTTRDLSKTSGRSQLQYFLDDIDDCVGGHDPGNTQTNCRGYPIPDRRGVISTFHSSFTSGHRDDHSEDGAFHQTGCNVNQ